VGAASGVSVKKRVKNKSGGSKLSKKQNQRKTAPRFPSSVKKTQQRKPSPETGFPVVGIGASAGGIEAFQQFFHEIPPDTGMAYVAITHLAPQHESNLPGILARVASIPVVPVTDNIQIRTNHVYVIPPDSDLTLANNRLKLVPRKLSKGLHLPIDQFFRSLAEKRPNNAIAVILSGEGSDGALGIRYAGKYLVKNFLSLRAKRSNLVETTKIAASLRSSQ